MNAIVDIWISSAAPEATASPALIKWTNVERPRGPIRCLPGPAGQALRSKSTHAWAPRPYSPLPFGKSRGRRRCGPIGVAVDAASRLVAAEAPDRRARCTASPNRSCGDIRPTVRDASPGPHPPATVVTSDGATGCAPIGVNAWASCDASAIISPRPAAANRTVFFMRCHLLFSFAARRAEKRFPPRNAIDRAAAGSSFASIGRLRHRITEGAGQNGGAWG